MPLLTFCPPPACLPNRSEDFQNPQKKIQTTRKSFHVQTFSTILSLIWDVDAQLQQKVKKMLKKLSQPGMASACRILLCSYKSTPFNREDNWTCEYCLKKHKRIMVSDPVTVIRKLDTKLMDLNINTMLNSTRVFYCDPCLCRHTCTHRQTSFKLSRQNETENNK